MRTLRFLLPGLSLILFACAIGGTTAPGATQAIPTGSGPGAKKCGDGICGAKESAASCPQDCSPATAGATEGPLAVGSLTPGTRENTYWMINPASGATL